MKKTLFITLLFVVAVTLLYAVRYPHTLMQMEYTCNFSFSSDFVTLKLSDVPALTSWLGNFLLQFFRWPVAGAFIEALLLGAASLGCAMIPKAMGRKGYTELSLLVGAAVLWLFPHFIHSELQMAFFFWTIAGYFAIRSRVTRLVAVVCFSVVGFFLITWTQLFVFLLIAAAGEYFHFKTRWAALVPLGCIAIAVADVFVSSNVLGFIPYDARFFAKPEYNVSMWIYIALLIVPILLMLIERKGLKGAGAWVPAALAAVVAGIAICVSMNGQTKEFSELCFRYSQMADQGRWQQLLDEIPTEDLAESKMKRAYALMAESQLGSLPENIGKYPIFTPSDFLYSHEMKLFSCNFNRQFYENIGLYDEAFHMAFEYNTMAYDGVCMGALRDMTRYLVKEGDYKLADKYLTKLSKTLFNGAFVKEMRRQMTKKPKETIDKLPLRADNFVACYNFNSEMVRLLQLDPHNKKLLDYLLCGLLIDHRLKEFGVILNGFPIYQGKQLPKAYAEAAAMLTAQGVDVRPRFQYAADYDRDFKEFYSVGSKPNPTQEDVNLINRYRGTYWYNYFFMQPTDQITNGTNNLRAVN